MPDMRYLLEHDGACFIFGALDMASISDDDLCSDCRHCEYRPGDDSGCVKDFPGETNSDGYVIRCEWFIGILHPGDPSSYTLGLATSGRSRSHDQWLLGLGRTNDMD